MDEVCSMASVIRSAELCPHYYYPHPGFCLLGLLIDNYFRHIASRLTAGWYRSETWRGARKAAPSTARKMPRAITMAVIVDLPVVREALGSWCLYARVMIPLKFR